MTGPAAPLISVVLPVGNVAEFLPACLDSVLGPDTPGGPAGQAGLEVIAVDDASPDGCGRILDHRAGQDPRLRVVHLAENAGPGPARMRGLAEAAGTYVWFVDPDDLLADGALAAVAARLAAPGRMCCSSTTWSWAPRAGRSRARARRCWPRPGRPPRR